MSTRYRGWLMGCSVVVAVLAASCASSGSMASGEAVLPFSAVADDSMMASTDSESDFYIEDTGNLVYGGYNQVVPIEGLNSRLKLKVTSPGPDAIWKTADDEIQFYVRENFASDGRLLSVESYNEFADGGGVYFEGEDRVVKRLENVGFDAMGHPVDQAITRDGERSRRTLEYNGAGFNTRTVTYNGINMVVGEAEYIWNAYWDDDEFIVRRYGVTSHGTTTREFVIFRYTDDNRSRLLGVDVCSQEGQVAERLAVDDAFSGPVTLSTLETVF